MRTAIAIFIALATVRVYTSLRLTSTERTYILYVQYSSGSTNFPGKKRRWIVYTVYILERNEILSVRRKRERVKRAGEKEREKKRRRDREGNMLR